MSTGSIQDAAVLVMPDLRHDALQLSFVNDSGARLTTGQEVTLKTDGTINKRSAGSEVPLGVVVVPADDGNRVTVRTYFTAVIKATAKGGTLNAGDYVKPNGNKGTDGIPEYVARSGNDYAVGMVVKGGDADAEIVVGIIDGMVIGDPDSVYLQETLSAYSADDESAAYTAQDTEDIAKLADLNALREAYENLRAAHEDMRAKLVSAGILEEPA